MTTIFLSLSKRKENKVVVDNLQKRSDIFCTPPSSPHMQSADVGNFCPPLLFVFSDLFPNVLLIIFTFASFSSSLSVLTLPSSLHGKSTRILNTQMLWRKVYSHCRNICKQDNENHLLSIVIDCKIYIHLRAYIYIYTVQYTPKYTRIYK